MQYFVLADVAQRVERLDDNLKVAGISPLCAASFIPTQLACWHKYLQLEIPQSELLKRNESNRVY